MPFATESHPHRRFNALTREWILVSPHRTLRPWQGRTEPEADGPRPAYDPNCYLCPGNRRAGDAVNPPYGQTFVFDNDFAALLPRPPTAEDQPHLPHPLLRSEPARGVCRVICFSPRHDLTLPELPLPQIRAVIDLWADQTLELGKAWRWVQVFENKGALMGCSNPHPHGQVWAGDFLPHTVSLEDQSQRDYAERHEAPLLLDYLAEELRRGERIVEANPHWVLLVPYWATWPFELLLLPRRHVARFPDLSSVEREALAEILQRGLTRYDNLFRTSFPYSLGWHGAPQGDQDVRHWQLHAHFFPPLLRSATIRKFMVGYELLAEPQRDLTPESAAQRLRDLPTQHYKLPTPSP